MAYAITYGVTPFGLAQQLQEQGVTVPAAQQLINSFLNCFQGVKQYMDACTKAATEQGYVRTLLGRRRPIQGLQVRDIGGGGHGHVFVSGPGPVDQRYAEGTQYCCAVEVVRYRRTPQTSIGAYVCT